MYSGKQFLPYIPDCIIRKASLSPLLSLYFVLQLAGMHLMRHLDTAFTDIPFHLDRP